MDNYCPDQTDLDILRFLQKDANLTYKELSYHLRKGKSAIQKRVKQLEVSGYISAFVAIVNPTKFETCIISFLQVQLKLHSLDALRQFQAEVSAFPEVLECYHTTGGFDFILKVASRGMAAYNTFLLDKLGKLENIGTLNSSLVISQTKRETAIPL